MHKQKYVMAPDQTTYNLMLRLYLAIGEVEKAEELFFSQIVKCRGVFLLKDESLLPMLAMYRRQGNAAKFQTVLRMASRAKQKQLLTALDRLNPTEN